MQLLGSLWEEPSLLYQQINQESITVAVLPIPTVASAIFFQLAQPHTPSAVRPNRRKIYKAAARTGAWGYVEPLSMTPTWVHFDRRYGKPACRSTTAGYPTLRRGSRSTYVLILQDALNALGYSTNTLDGIFGKATENALKACQRRFSLTADGVCGCASWRMIAEATVGIGKTETVIDA